MTITRSLRATLVAIALLTVAACGGGGGDDDDDDKAASTANATDQSTQADEADSPTEDSEPAPENDDTDDTESSAAAGDPCGLVTSAEAEEIIGHPVGEGHAREMEDVSFCEYGDGSFRIGLLGDGIPKDEWEAAEREQDGLEEVSGLGELAFFDPHNQVLDVFADGLWIQGGLDAGSGVDIKPMLTEVLRIALERV